jgi:O-antigen ligase
MGDVQLWRENFILGVGVGASKDLRPTTEEIPTAAHVELSRLLAEHGIFGLLFFIALLTLPFSILSQNDDSLTRAILVAFFILGMYTSFHAAMRTYVTPLFISLSLVTVREKRPNVGKKENTSKSL